MRSGYKGNPFWVWRYLCPDDLFEDDAEEADVVPEYFLQFHEFAQEAASLARPLQVPLGLLISTRGRILCGRIARKHRFVRGSFIPQKNDDNVKKKRMNIM